MAKATMRTIFSRRFLSQFSSRNRSRQHPSHRLVIQQLEDRTVPAIYTVNALTDTGTADLGDPFKGDLRYCITQANASVGVADTINFDNAATAGQTILLTAALPVITDVVSINGPALNNLPGNPTDPNCTIDGQNAVKIFNITDAAAAVNTFTISKLRLVNGTATDNGGAINLNTTTDNLTVTDCVLSNNTAASMGGAIGTSAAVATTLGTISLARNVFTSNKTTTNFGGAVGLDCSTAPVPTSGWQANISDCVFDGNASNGNGGGLFIRVPNCKVTVSGTTFMNGTAGAYGGGVSLLTAPGGDVKFENCTFFNNSAVTPASGKGAAFSNGGGNSGTIYFRSCTISGNTSYNGGALASTSGSPTIYVESSILFGNLATNNGKNDFDSANIKASNSIIQDKTGSSTFTDLGGNLFGLSNDPLLAAPAANGGLTLTMLPGPFSPAREAGANPSGATFDQRGTGFPRLLGTKYDIGAVESQDPNPLASASAKDVLTPGGTTYQFTVNYSDDNKINTSTVIGKNNVIEVTGPNGFSQFAIYKSIDNATNGTPRIATYEITAPVNGAAGFDKTDNGLYVVSIIDGLVADTDSTVHTVKGGQIGSFNVGVPTTFIVSSDADSGPDTLRQAILDANALLNSKDVITFAAGMTGKTIKLSAEILISDPLVIDSGSSNPSTITISGENVTRILNINGPGSATVDISGVTFANGNSGLLNGGAIEIDSEALTLTNCAFTGNSAGDTGGAIHLNIASASVVATNCTFTNNSANLGGAIARFSNGPVTLIGCSLTNNTATIGDGGAVRMQLGSITIKDSLLAYNTATAGSGGALSMADALSLVYLRNSTISNNSAAVNGGGISTSNYGAVVQLLNCTIADNTAASGAGVTHSGTSSGASVGGTEITSSIIFGNSGSNDIDIAGFKTIYTNSIIGSKAGASEYVDGGGNLPFGTNPIISGLSNNGGASLTHGLLPGSPAINAGLNPAPALSFDQRGTGFPRLLGAGVDIGAFEGVLPVPSGLMTPISPIILPGSTPNKVVVTYNDETGLNASTFGLDDIEILDPLSNPLAVTSFSVDVPGNGSPRTVTYTFTPPVNSSAGWDSSDNGQYSVNLVAGKVSDTDTPTPHVTIAQSLGTFNVSIILVTNAGDSGPGSLRDAMTIANTLPGSDVISFDPAFFTGSMKTIQLLSDLPVLNGAVSINGPGSNLATVSGEGAFRVIDTTISAPGTLITISGLTIANGSTAGNGGGININDENVIVQNCVIQNNTAGTGGGVYVSAAAGSLSVLDSTITGNKATGGNGGGIDVGAATGTVFITNSTITNNVASAEGGGVSTLSTGITLSNAKITNNTANAGNGGAINLGTSNVNVDIATSTISGNSASSDGGAMYFINGGSLKMTRSTVSGNTSSGALGGGAVYFFGGINANGFKVSNSTFSANTATSGGGGAIFFSTLSGTVEVLNSTIVGNSAVNGGGISRDNGGGLTITSSVVAGNSATGVAKDVNFGTAVVNATFSAIGSDGAGSLNDYSGAGKNNIPLATPLNLGGLANNGGPTLTHLPGAGSPLLNAGSNPSPLSPDVDQIGSARTSGAQTDIGSVEVLSAAPVVSGFVVNDGAAQRSRLTKIVVSFTSPVNLATFTAAGAVFLTRTGIPTNNLGTVGTVVNNTNGLDIAAGPTANDITLTFQNITNAGVEFGSLSDGRWQLSIVPATYTSPNGPGDIQLRRLFGNINNDTLIDGGDFGAYPSFGAAVANPFDFNNDGNIDAGDFGEFGNRFGFTLI